MGVIFKWLVFISSYVPIFIMIFLKNLSSFSISSFTKTWNNGKYFWIATLIISGISITALIFWLCLLKKLSRENSNEYPIGQVKADDTEILNFFVTFIIPILSLNPSSWPSIAMNGFLLIIEGIYFVGNNALYFNILLIFARYHIYSWNENIIITKKRKEELVPNMMASQVGTTNIFYI